MAAQARPVGLTGGRQCGAARRRLDVPERLIFAIGLFPPISAIAGAPIPAPEQSAALRARRRDDHG